MLVQLLGYEFYKKWKVLGNILGGFIVIQALLLTIIRVFLGSDATRMVMEIGTKGQNGSLTAGWISLLYFLFAAGLFVLPFIENVYRFEQDLSGKQAVLELMIPIISWKKLLSKLIMTLFSTIVCQMMAALSILAFFLVNSNFNKALVDLIFKNAKIIISSPAKSSCIALSMLFVLASLYMLVMFSIAFSKSISHKNRIAVPIGIGTFIASIVISIVVVIQIGKYPMVKFDLFGIEQSLSQMIFDLAFIVLPFLGASSLMEKRIEN